MSKGYRAGLPTFATVITTPGYVPHHQDARSTGVTHACLVAYVYKNTELAFNCAALILYDDGIAITAEKISTLVKVAKVTVDSHWPPLFAKLLEKRRTMFECDISKKCTVKV
ncbi:hypothetical protein Taro_037006 [Colocasia esculenta]|uniref:Uncharacterized protein n=1 Tax=Colocasia esculenta TaxID=4460 RepID=A0A843W311_COLES|nr:hypothetical protein [Colocasia esculenta]